MAAFGLQRITAETQVRQLEYYDDVDSTNDVALQLVAQQESCFPLLVLADRQHRGRGRGRNSWWAGPGALTFTIVWDGRASRLPTRTWPQISLSTALAVCDALRKILPDQEPRLKWPNDVYLQSRKVCGILVESSPLRPGLRLIGVGVNVNNSIRHSPPELQATATSLIDVAARSFDRTEVLVRILQAMASRLQQLEEESLQLPDRWRHLCMLHGRTLVLHTGTQQTVGVCQGIDDEGALLLQGDTGVQRFFSGVVARVL